MMCTIKMSMGIAMTKLSEIWQLYSTCSNMSFLRLSTQSSWTIPKTKALLIHSSLKEINNNRILTLISKPLATNRCTNSSRGTCNSYCNRINTTSNSNKTQTCFNNSWLCLNKWVEVELPGTNSQHKDSQVILHHKITNLRRTHSSNNKCNGSSSNNSNSSHHHTITTNNTDFIDYSYVNLLILNN